MNWIKRLPIFLLLLTPLTSVAYQKGMALGLYSKDPLYSYENDLKEIRQVGSDHVSLVVSWYQKDIHATKIYPHWKTIGDFDTLPDEKLIEVIDQAHQQGLKVFLFPILRIEERKDKEWRGVLAPNHLVEWEKSYRQFTFHYAHLAAQHHVELFSVGSELCSLEKEVSFWKSLIREMRGFYQGELLYSANWDHYKKIEFWEDLDYLGLNAYYELTENLNPTLEELTYKWWNIENELASWQETIRKKIIITEIGYPSLDGACGKPWDYTRNAAIDLDEQALCYEAFFLSWNSSNKLAGVYFWNWYGQGGPNDRTYTPRGKPAQQVLSKWFQKDSSVPSPFSYLPPPSSPAQEPRMEVTKTSRPARRPSS